MSNKDPRKMSISSFGGTTWKWYLFSSCSLGLRERGYGTVLVQFLPHDAIFFHIWTSELCKMGISVHFRDESTAKRSLRRVQEGELRCQMEWTKHENKFNQVSPDHSPKWLTDIGKRGGGIMDITKTPAALSRWALSYNLRSQKPENTHTMFRLHQEDKFSHSESTPGRKDRDNKDECSLLTILKQFKVLGTLSNRRFRWRRRRDDR